jgi:transcriptional/translational regulatory protein YebC/TACO1
LQFIPENEISLDPENSKKFFDLIDAIEWDEDVDKVRHNVKI